MDYDLWANNIKKNIEIFSDVDRQEKGWTKGDMSANTLGWNEEICDLFDSNCFDAFLEQYKEQLGSELFPLLSYLKNKLDKYQGHEDDADILKDPQWLEISKLAKQVFTVWQTQNP